MYCKLEKSKRKCMYFNVKAIEHYIEPVNVSFSLRRKPRCRAVSCQEQVWGGRLWFVAETGPERIKEVAELCGRTRTPGWMLQRWKEHLFVNLRAFCSYLCSKLLYFSRFFHVSTLICMQFLMCTVNLYEYVALFIWYYVVSGAHLRFISFHNTENVLYICI